jgi:hypothetical protein
MVVNKPGCDITAANILCERCFYGVSNKMKEINGHEVMNNIVGSAIRFRIG